MVVGDEEKHMTAAHNDTPDVIVIGGGPAGSTVSTLIAQQGHSVQLFERERFPRFHIGESLIPQTYWVIRRLNLLDKMKQSHFVKKFSVQFINQHGKLSEPFYFFDNNPHECSQTWQVYRQEFDELMLQNARDHGVEVHEGARVLEVLFEGERATGVRVVLGDGNEREVPAKVIVDASGQSSMIMSRLGLRDWDPVLRKAALWTYWKGAERDTGRDEGATLVIQTQNKQGWFWYIPLHNDIVSVGVVAAFDYLFLNRGTDVRMPEFRTTDLRAVVPGSSKDLESIYFEEVERCPGVQPRIKNATRCDIYRAAKEYSYRARQAAGDGWVLIGDAFGFLDPLYSSGVLLALKSGEMAADAICEGLARNDTTAAQLGKWGAEFGKGMDRMRNLVCAYYDGFSFGRFVKKYPHLKGMVTDVLIGDLFKDDVDVLWPLMAEMRESGT
jgi:flavin-dependent dehydrogenase